MLFPEGSMLALAPLLVPIELVSYVFRVISLPVRLFANMMAGHILLKVIVGFSWSMLHLSGFMSMAHIFPLIILTVLFNLETFLIFPDLKRQTVTPSSFVTLIFCFRSVYGVTTVTSCPRDKNSIAISCIILPATFLLLGK